MQQQRQPRLGDILDDYCPRERRVTNHAVVAMVGVDVKQTRCTTCDTEHEFKHAKVPRQRRKAETPAALYAQTAAAAPKRVVHDALPDDPVELAPALDNGIEFPASIDQRPIEAPVLPDAEIPVEPATEDEDAFEAERGPDEAEGPVHRPLIRATLPRQEGQPPPTRPAPEFTIRQPAGRQNRFRPRPQRNGGQFQQGNRSNGGFSSGAPHRGGMPRQGGGRPPIMSRIAKRQGGPGRKRSK